MNEPEQQEPEFVPYLDLSELGDLRGVVIVNDQVEVVSEPPAEPAQPPSAPGEPAQPPGGESGD